LQNHLDILQQISELFEDHVTPEEQKCDGKIHIIDETTGKKYSGEIKIINNKPVLEYEEIK